MPLFGPDGSYWQFRPRSSVDLELADDDWGSISFMLWRSSIGTRTDTSFATMRDAAKARRKAFAAYHWVYPTSRYPAQAQAAAMATANPDRAIPVMLDWETESGLFPTIDDCDRVANAMRGLGYRVPLLYTGVWYWGLAQIGKPTLTGRGYDLVLADYNTNPNLEPLPAYNTAGGDNAVEWRRQLGGLTPTIWQFGSRVKFGGLSMDMNAYRGSVHELERWFYVDKPPAPKPTPAPTPPLEVDDMVELWKLPDHDAVYVVNLACGFKTWLAPSRGADAGRVVDQRVELHRILGADPEIKTQHDRDMFAAYGPVIGPRPGEVDDYGIPQ